MERIKTVDVEQIASFVSMDLGMSKNDVLRAFNSQFSFISNHIKNGKKETVKLDFFGKFKRNIIYRKRGGDE